MRHYLSFITVLGLLFSAPAYADSSVNVFACEPEWAALAKEIGGDKVDIFSATTAQQDPHHIRAKPSLIAAMRKADLVICSGSELEVGWLPILLQKAGKNIQPLFAAELVPMLDKPSRLDRAEGDIHPGGNPHLQLNPHNIALVAKELTTRLSQIDASHADIYQTRYDAFSRKWQEAIAKWEKSAADLKGIPVVVHHKSFTYFLGWLGMQEVGSLEPKPGIPPTTSHLESLLISLKNHPARVIIRTPYEPEDASKWLSEKTGIPAIVLPYTVGGNAQSGDLFSLFDYTIVLLKEANHGQR